MTGKHKDYGLNISSWETCSWKIQFMRVDMIFEGHINKGCIVAGDGSVSKVPATLA